MNMKHTALRDQNREVGTPELTVSMPAYNTGKYIGEAIESILQQEGIDLELIVVDDGSQDHTAEVVQTFKDSRVRLIRNKTNMGISFCHNVVIKQSRAPFIAHVDSDDLVLPGAFQKMVDKLKSSSHIGQAHCYFFDINEKGRLTRNEFRKRRRSFLNNRTPDMDYKRELLVHGSVMNHLRTYRREVFDVIGKFNEKLTYGEDYEMALRIIDKYEIGLVPEFLYCRRVHDVNTAALLRFQGLRFWFQRVFFCLRFIINGEVRFLRYSKYNVKRLMMRSLLHTLQVHKITQFIRSLKKLPRKGRDFMSSHLFIMTRNKVYDSMVRNFSWWPVELYNFRNGNNRAGKKRIAYYLWHFPVLSETFIQREVQALQESGMSVEVVADGTGNIGILGKNAKALIKDTTYLLPANNKRISRYLKHFFFRNPLRFLNLFLYVMFHDYGRSKNLKEDVVIFVKSVYLAGILKDKKITHVHSPWANLNSFIAMIASKLLRIPYTVQGRASADLYRKASSYALPEKLSNAEFIITNSGYNQSYLREFLEQRDWEKIHTIYEGLDLERFEYPDVGRQASKEITILAVARLIETKGLIYLLKACRILKEEGYVFRCNIVGGRETSYMNYYIQLQKYYRQAGLDGHVSFLGTQPFQKVLEHYRQSDIFVLPCVIAEDGSRDITPNSLIEAMAMRLPVISTTLSSIHEIVEDGVSGILVPPNDAQSLAETLIRLINDHDERERLADNARKRIEEKFDINRNIMSYADLFNGGSRTDIQVG